MNPYRRRVHHGAAAAIVGCLFAFGLSTPVEAAAKPFKMSKSGLETSCKRYGGNFYSNSYGVYGCSYPDGSVTECTKKGVCNHYVFRELPSEQTRAPVPDSPNQPDPIVPPPNPQPPSDDVGAAGAVG